MRSPAWNAGLRAGDRIYQADGQDFQDSDTFLKLLADREGAVELQVERNGKLRSVELNLPETRNER